MFNVDELLEIAVSLNQKVVPLAKRLVGILAPVNGARLYLDRSHLDYLLYFHGFMLEKVRVI